MDRNKTTITPADLYLGSLVAWLIGIVLIFVIPGPRNVLRGATTLKWTACMCTV